MKDELLPCPFGCAEEPYIDKNIDYYGYPVYILEHTCINDTTKIRIRHHDEAIVIKTWNTRQPTRKKVKPIYHSDKGQDMCGKCGEWIEYIHYKYCHECGTEIDRQNDIAK